MLRASSTANRAGAASNPVRGPSQSSCDGTFARKNNVDFVSPPFFSMKMVIEISEYKRTTIKGYHSPSTITDSGSNTPVK